LFQKEKLVSKKAIYEQEAKVIAQGTRSLSPVSFWKPKVGKNLIRILPNKRYLTETESVFFKKLRVHWNVGPSGRRVICRKTLGQKEECPVCSFVERLLATGKSEDATEAQSMQCSERYVMSIVDVNDQAKGIQIFECAKTTFNDILALFLDDEYGELDSLSTGRNIKIDRVGTTRNDTKYTIFPSISASAVKSAIMEKVYDIEALYSVPDIDAVDAILRGEDENVKDVEEEEEGSSFFEEPDSKDSSIEGKVKDEFDITLEDTDEETGETVEENEKPAKARVGRTSRAEQLKSARAAISGSGKTKK
jgi:hypothetical protein